MNHKLSLEEEKLQDQRENDLSSKMRVKSTQEFYEGKFRQVVLKKIKQNRNLRIL